MSHRDLAGDDLRPGPEHVNLRHQLLADGGQVAVAAQLLFRHSPAVWRGAEKKSGAGTAFPGPAEQVIRYLALG